MAYYTGNAANLAAVLTALTSCCETEGWTYSGGILYKADPGIYVRLDATTVIGTAGPAPFRLWARNVSEAEAPGYVSMQGICNEAITYPVTYHCFVFTNEVYFIINWSDKYQWCAFGQSQQPGLGGSGNWVAASVGSATYRTDYGSWKYPLTTNIMCSAPSCIEYADRNSPTFMWYPAGTIGVTASSSSGYSVHRCNFFMDVGLDSGDANHPWMPSLSTLCPGKKYIEDLILTQPNAFNNEGVLLPIKVIKTRASSKYSQVLQLENARNIRINNYTPQEIIALGTDQWMIFPWYKKNASVPDGGENITHTGTMGWAIKYEP